MVGLQHRNSGGGLRQQHKRVVEEALVPCVVCHVAHCAVAALEQLARQRRVGHQHAVGSRKPAGGW